MKRLITVAFLGVLYCSTTASAQTISPLKDKEKILAPRQLLTEKPRLFSRLPEKFIVGKPILDKLFTGSSKRISSAGNQEFPFDGEIIERVQKNPNVVSVNIKLTNYDGAMLNVSRIINSDLSVSYIGRAININSGDVLLLKNENGKFYFSKEKQSLTMVE
jgi:hypothetical protein